MNYYKITDRREQKTKRKYKTDDELKRLPKCWKGEVQGTKKCYKGNGR